MLDIRIENALILEKLFNMTKRLLVKIIQKESFVELPREEKGSKMMVHCFDTVFSFRRFENCVKCD